MPPSSPPIRTKSNSIHGDFRMLVSCAVNPLNPSPKTARHHNEYVFLKSSKLRKMLVAG